MRREMISLTTIALLLLIALPGCSDPKKKIAVKLNDVVRKCRKGDGVFVELELEDKERTKHKVLRAACEAKPGEIKMLDKFRSETAVGPYKIGIGQDTARVWIFNSIEWEAMDTVLRELDRKDRPSNSYDRVEEELAKAEKVLPDNAWIRQTRLDNLLVLRKRTRRKDANPDLGKQAGDYYAALLKWAKDKPAVEQKARLSVVTYYNKYKTLLSKNLEGGNEYATLEAAIKQAVQDKNKADEEKYRKELAARQARQEKVVKETTERIKKLDALLCAEAAKLNGAVVKKDKKLSVQITAMQSAVKCP